MMPAAGIIVSQLPIAVAVEILAFLVYPSTMVFNSSALSLSRFPLSFHKILIQCGSDVEK